MSLSQTICAVLTLTRELVEALEIGDMDTCASLLERRGLAMTAFEVSHRTATPDALAACQDQVRALATQDQILQTAAVKARTAVGDQLRASAGASPQFGGSYDQAPTLACVDRKA